MEIFVEIQEKVRGQDAFIIQSTSFPANDHLIKVLIIADALRAPRPPHHRRASLFRLRPARSQTGPRMPISAKLVANLITRAGADRVLTVDLHAGQIQGFFHFPSTVCSPRRSLSATSRKASNLSQSSWSCRLTSAAWCAHAPWPSASTRRVAIVEAPRTRRRI